MICGLENFSLCQNLYFVKYTIPTIRLLGHENFLFDKLGVGTFFYSKIKFPTHEMPIY